MPYSASRADKIKLENTVTSGTAIQMPEAIHTYICDDCEFMTIAGPLRGYYTYTNDI